MAVLIYICVLTVGITCLLFHGVSCEVFNNCTNSSNPFAKINTTVYNDIMEVTGFPCTTHGGVNDPVCPLWPNNLPNGLSNGSSVAKPRNFDVTLFTDTVDFAGTFGIYSCAGAAFTWRVPVDESSRLNTKGYFLKMDQVESGSSNCRTFDLQGFKLDNSKLNFRFEMFPFPLSKGPASFVTTLYSLSPPSKDEMDEGLQIYERLVMTVPVCTSLTLYPEPLSGKWTTWIVVKNSTAGAVEVFFGMADDSLNFRFTQYVVRLFRNSTTSAPFNETVVKHVSGFGRYGTYVFQNVPSDAYYIHVRADDPYFQDKENCLCNAGFEEPPMPGKKCIPCERSVTSVFTVSGVPLATTTTPVTVPTTTTTAIKPTTPQSPAGPDGVSSTETNTGKPTSDTTKDTSDPAVGASTGNREATGVDRGAVAGAVIGSLAFVAIVAVAAVLCWKRSPHWIHIDFNKNNLRKNNLRNKPDKVWTLNAAFPGVTGPVDKVVPQLKRKRVFLLAAEDHPYHMKAVEMYAEFLRVHCYCDVIFTPQCRAELRGKIVYCWISGEIEQADYVVIITSMAAYRLYQAFQKGCWFHDADFGPEGDLFTPGLQHICGMITCNADMQKVVMVHFDHTVSDLRLPIGALPSSLYLLPKHLSDFLKHIHAVDNNSSGLSKVLPLQCNISQLPEGNAWLSAIQEAKAFERGYPNWFDEKFGKPSEVTKSLRAIPDFTTQESGFYSHEGGSIGSRNSADLQRRLSSVSMVAERFISGFDPADPRAITKDDFIEPSMCFSAYTVPPGSTFEDGNLPEEIDDRVSTTSERLHRFNQRYELDRLEETGEGGVGHYPIVQAATDTVYLSQGCTFSGVHEEMAQTYESQSRGIYTGNEHVYITVPQVQAGINLRADDAPQVQAGINLRADDAHWAKEDCVSISAQSV